MNKTFYAFGLLALILTIGFLPPNLNDFHGVVATTKTKIVDNKVYTDPIFQSYDAYITNTNITGYITVKGESKVYMGSVTLYGNVHIVLEDSARLKMENVDVKASTLSIELYDNSYLNIYSITSSSSPYMTFDARDNSSVIISIINFDGGYNFYDNSTARFIDAHCGLDIYAYDNVSLEIRDSTISDDIMLNDAASIQMLNVHMNTRTLLLYGATTADIFDSEIGDIEIRGESSINFYDSTATAIYVYGASEATINSSQVDTMYVRTSPEAEMSAFGGVSNIDNSNITNLYLYTGRVSSIEDSYIANLYYAKIYTGSSVVYTSSGFSASNTKNNYVASSSTIVSITQLQSSFINTYDVDIRFGVPGEELYIYHAHSATFTDYPDASIRLYAWNTSFFVRNYTFEYIASWGSRFNFESINSSITSSSTFDFSYSGVLLSNSVFDNQLDLTLIYSSISTANTILGDGSLYAVGESVWMSNLTFSNFHYSFSYCDVTIKNSTLNGDSMFIMDTYVSAEYSQLPNITAYNYMMINGNFEINGGLVHVNSGSLVYGVEDKGGTTIAGISMSSISITNSDVTIRGVLANYSYYSSLDIYTEFSSLTMENIESNADIYLRVYNGTASLANVPLARSLDAWNSTISITNANFSDIDIHNVTFTMESSSITSIDAQNSTIILNSVDAYEIQIMWYPDIDSDFTKVPESTINITDSNISSMLAFCEGNINIENSNIGTLYYVFTYVNIKNSHIDFTTNNKLFTSGNVTIENGAVTKGSPINLLTYTGTTITALEDAYVFHILEPNTAIRIENTNVYGVVGIAKSSVYVYNSEFSIFQFATTNTLVFYNSKVDTDMPSFEAFLFASEMSIVSSNWHLETLIVWASTAYFYNTTLNITGLYAVNTSITINTPTFLDSGVTIGIIFSEYSILMDCSVASIEIESSTVDVQGGNIGVISAETSNVTLDSVNVNVGLSIDSTTNATVLYSMLGSIVTKTDYPRIYSRITVNHSSILGPSVYHYEVFDYYGVKLNNGTLTGTVDVMSQYYDSTVDGPGNAVYVEVLEHGKAIIRDYSGGSSIKSIYVDTYEDNEAPTITVLNSTPIEFESGLQASAVFILDDETPTNYSVYLNDNEIKTENYTSNYTLIVDLDALPIELGGNNLTIVARDNEDHSNTLQVSVNVYPTEPPTITVAPEETYNISVGETLTLTWKANDKSPDEYYIYINGSEVDSGNWTDNQEITYQFNASEIGTYNITIVFEDKLNQSSKNTVIIHVHEETQNNQTNEEQPNQGGGTGTTEIPTQYIAIIVVALVAILAVAVLMKRRKK